MVAGGVPIPEEKSGSAILDLALDMQEIMGTKFSNSLLQTNKTKIDIRIGISSGYAVAGIIGKRKFSYDVWGDSVNTASRMESHGIAGKIQVTDAVYRNFNQKYNFQSRGRIHIKGKGDMQVWILESRKAGAIA